MQAITFYEYGSPDVLQLEEIKQPTPDDDEVLVKVRAVAANPLDWHLLRGEPFLARLESGLRKPKFNILGADVAGTIAAIGKDVTDFKVGDAVFGDVFSSKGPGGFAEYVTVPASSMVHKPENISYEAAAATPVAAITALQGLRQGGLAAGQKVLINGASGGVGTFAVQIAKSYDTEVTGVCSTHNLEMVRSIGADHVLDYTAEDFTKTGQQYDLIFDAVGNRSVGDLKRALTPTGVCKIAGFTTLPRLLQHVIVGKLQSRKDGQQIGLMGTANVNKADLLILAKLLEDGTINPVIDRRYPLSETADAIRYLETMRARGKVIIMVG